MFKAQISQETIQGREWRLLTYKMGGRTTAELHKLMSGFSTQWAEVRLWEDEIPESIQEAVDVLDLEQLVA